MDGDLERFVRERGGVVRWAELRALGMRERQLRQQVAAGEWRRAGRQILVHASAQEGLVTDTLTVARRLPDAIATGSSAAVLNPHPAWSDLRLANQRPTMITRRAGRANCRAVLHPGAVGLQHTAGLLVADHHTTLVDLIRFLPWSDAAATAARGVALKVTSVGALEASTTTLGSAAGVQQLRRITRSLERGAESGPEIDLHRALNRAHIQGWQANPTLRVGDHRFRPDVFFPAERIVVEYDGFAEHSGGVVFAADRQRANAFAFVGYTVLRLTAATLYDERRLADFIGELRVLLRQRRAGGRRGSAAIGDRVPA